MQVISLNTGHGTKMHDITDDVRAVVSKSGVTDGICTAFIPHTTAGITINENADPDVIYDMTRQLDKTIPINDGYRHAEGNSAAHIKASLMGSSVSVIVQNTRLILGTWQGIYFCEFDGPRSRKIYVSIG